MIFKPILHFMTICKHKHYVRKYCWKVGLYKRGLLHDLSKFSPTEFFESVKYFNGRRSPIEECEAKNGYSKAGLHHKGRNTHHYQYWIDERKDGTWYPIEMPFEDIAEMVCDFLGAGKTYMKDRFTYAQELKWWERRKRDFPHMLIHQNSKDFISQILTELTIMNEDKVLNKQHLKNIYNTIHNQQ